MIEPKYFWLNVILLAAGTFAIRASFIALAERVRISAVVRELFSFIPAAILPALIVPAVFFHRGQVEWLHGKERLMVALFVGATSYFVRSTLFTILFGMISLYLITRM